jgi:hypothetical protein
VGQITRCRRLAASFGGASLNGVDLGAYPIVMTAPKFVGFEGVGVLDNFVVKQPPQIRRDGDRESRPAGTTCGARSFPGPGSDAANHGNVAAS